jgi:hypothetical protein
MGIFIVTLLLVVAVTFTATRLGSIEIAKDDTNKIKTSFKFTKYED